MKIIVKIFLRIYKFLFRVSKGAFGGKMRGIDVLILNTVGRKSGRIWSVPIGYLMDSDNYVVAAFNGGAAKHPSWYHNLKSNPDIVIEIKGGQKINVQAKEAKGEDRERLWNQFTAAVSDDDNYDEKIERTIPVMLLRPQD